MVANSAPVTRDVVPRVGASTIATGSVAFEQPGVPFPIEVVELCNVGLTCWPRLLQLPRDPALAVGLHCPIPFDGWVRRFEITGPDEAGISEAVALVERTLAAAAEIHADYVVTHFPSVLREPPGDAIRPARARETAKRVAASLQELAAEHGVRLFLENVGPNPHFHRAEHYCEVFESTPDLRMCLDFGHAHVLDGPEDVYEFTRIVAPHVASVHLYNATRESYRVGFHRVPAREQTREHGWMDLRALLRHLREAAPLEFVVFEYSAADGNDAPEVVEELHDLHAFVRETWSPASAAAQ
jgi:sugar phosphate isomerase/epimerase